MEYGYISCCRLKDGVELSTIVFASNGEHQTVAIDVQPRNLSERELSLLLQHHNRTVSTGGFSTHIVLVPTGYYDFFKQTFREPNVWTFEYSEKAAFLTVITNMYLEMTFTCAMIHRVHSVVSNTTIYFPSWYTRLERFLA